MCLINSHRPQTGACAIYGTEKWENVPNHGYQVTNTVLPKFGCETRSLWNPLVLSAHQIFNPDMSCLNYSGAHKPFIRIRGEIFGLICRSHISKDLGGSFSIPSRKVTRLVLKGSWFSAADDFKQEMPSWFSRNQYIAPACCPLGPFLGP